MASTFSSATGAAAVNESQRTHALRMIKLISSILNDGPPSLELARDVYRYAVDDTLEPGAFDKTDGIRDKFIQDMYTMARGDDFSVAFEWKKSQFF